MKLEIMKPQALFLVVICIVLQIVHSTCTAQDIHLSQFNSCPQNLNPSQTGLFNGDWRFVGNLRSQWASVPVPYKTFSLSTDTRLKMNPANKWAGKFKNATPAVGLIVNTDKAGDSKFSTMQVLISASYIKKLGPDSMHFLSFGIQPGFTTKSFNINALTFDNQYSGDSYNAALSSGENFGKTRITYFDLGGGVTYLWRKTQRTQASLGVSGFHVNTPKQSFFNDRDIKLDVKTTVNGVLEYPVAEKLDVLPSFLFQKQGKFQETVLGLFGKYYLTPVNGMTTAVSLGGFYRLKDAFIAVASMDYQNFTVGISYDINTSALTAATNNRGGFEISVIYIFKKEVPFIAKKRVCPVYM